MERIDELWPGGPKYIQRPGVFSLGSDSVLLAAFARLGRVRRVCDLGCGGGVISILLAAYKPGLTVDGVELDPAAARQSMDNAALNGFDARINVINGDIREHRALLRAGEYDLAVSNPPYFPVGSGYSSESMSAAREEGGCSLEELCRAAAYAVRWGGSFALVHRPERLSELCCRLTEAGLEPKRLRLVQHRPGSAPNLVLLEAIRGARPGLSVEPPLIMTDGRGGDSEEIRKIYRRDGR